MPARGRSQSLQPQSVDGNASVAVRLARRSADVRWSEHRFVGGDPRCRYSGRRVVLRRLCSRSQMGRPISVNRAGTAVIPAAISATGAPGRRTIAFIMSTAAPLSPSTSLPIRTWLVVVIVGMTGQLAWTVENMYLNVFVYDVITTDATVIAVLVAASAATATCATLLIGAASDRVGRRRPFIAVGYVLWGATTATFGLVRPEGGAQAVQGVALAVAAIITLDCVMSFFGSSANDAAFNAWITESTTSANRGRLEG